MQSADLCPVLHGNHPLLLTFDQDQVGQKTTKWVSFDPPSEGHDSTVADSDQQLAAYQELFSHYAKFTMELRRAHGDRRGWDYDWGEWSAALIRVTLVAPTEVATEIDNFGRAINSFLNQVERGERTPLHDPLSPEEFEQARQAPAEAQVKLINVIRRSLGNDRKGLPFGIGG